jgi:SAM-dependent methyltransferase
LLLLNGNVYVGFGAHKDFFPWRVWLFGHSGVTIAGDQYYSFRADQPSEVHHFAAQGQRRLRDVRFVCMNAGLTRKSSDSNASARLNMIATTEGVPEGQSAAGTYVQYGCGLCAPQGWINFDASLTLRWERIPIAGKLGTKNKNRFPPNVLPGDIVRGLPIPNGSCSGVYASHVLEHLSLNDFQTALQNTRKLLRKGGIFRVVVPDLEWAAREYIRRVDQGDPAANQFFLDVTCLGKKERAKGIAALVHHSLATSMHAWMWDSLSLSQALRNHGFSHLRHCCFADCEDPMFTLVEDPQRFQNAIALEARV